MHSARVSGLVTLFSTYTICLSHPNVNRFGTTEREVIDNILVAAVLVNTAAIPALSHLSYSKRFITIGHIRPGKKGELPHPSYPVHSVQDSFGLSQMRDPSLHTEKRGDSDERTVTVCEICSVMWRYICFDLL